MVTFRRGARLDPRQVRDVRGRGVSGGGLALGGGGAIGLIVLVAFVLLGGDPGALIGGGGGQLGAQYGPGEGQSLAEECQTGEDANTRDDCRIVGFVNSVQAFWEDAFAGSNQRYEPAVTYLFSDAVQSGCGVASSATGPFYCPLDTSIYLDLTFFDALRSQLGAEGGPLAVGYVVAHEYGHHVQNLLGDLDTQGRSSGAEGRAVRTELQADCYAGVWAANGADTGYLNPPSRSEIAVALDAAAAVGDDRIQERTQGQVNPETWTHGSSAQRQDWFLVGYEFGDPAECDTFAADL
jgi:predicted metalloprotease